MNHFSINATNAYSPTLRMHGSHKVIAAEVRDEYVVIIRQYPSNTVNANGQPVPDRIIKEIYMVEGDRLVLKSEVEGVHTPSHYVQEKISFPVP